MAEKQTSWGCCNIIKDKDDKHMQCIECKKKYHFGCLGIDSSTKVYTDWNCPKCSRPKLKGTNNDETPVKPSISRTNYKITDSNVTKRSSKRQALSSPTSPVISEGLSQELIRNVINEAINKQMSNLMIDINKTIKNSISTHFKNLENKFEELQTSVSFISNQYDDMKKQLDTHLELVNKLKQENQTLQCAVTNLQNKVNLMEQHARANNVEIQCVPESKNENIINVIKQLSKSVGFNIKDNEIAHCTRIAKINPKTTRPRSIIVQLSAPMIRDQLLAAVIKFNKSNPSNKLNTSHLGIAGNKVPVYVCEHLSASNKSLHAAARQKAKELNYKHIWVRNGRIFMRKTDNSDYKLINSVECLNKLT